MCSAMHVSLTREAQCLSELAETFYVFLWEIGNQVKKSSKIVAVGGRDESFGLDFEGRSNPREQMVVEIFEPAFDL